MKRCRSWTIYALALCLQGCLLDIAPDRGLVDEAWKARMLAGEYGEWYTGRKSTYVGVTRDEIRSQPVLASATRYGIKIDEVHWLETGSWSAGGGLVSRVVGPRADVELFGKEMVRTHGFTGQASPDDYSYEFFLVVRPKPTGPAQLVKQWSFPRKDLALVTHPSGSAGFEVEGFVAVDAETKTATVTIKGLVRPFEDRVDLSGALAERRGG